MDMNASATVERDAVGFIADVKTAVAAYFVDRDLSQNADLGMMIKTAIILAVTVGAYALLLTNAFGPWQMLGLAAVIGVGIAGIGFSVAHDALHGAYSASPRVNSLLGFTFDLCGANGYMWKITHNAIHHTHTNIHGLDEDLTVSPLLRLSPHSEWKPIHRFQHLYAFFAYSLSTLFWVLAKDYKYFVQRDLGPYRNMTHKPGEWAAMIGSKALCYIWSIVVPLMVLDVTWWQFLIGWLTMHLMAGTILGVVFQLAHVVEETDHHTERESGGSAEWMVRQMETTSNFARENQALNWFVGGLNFQIEHHLFPRICSVHYPALSRIVRAAARDHGFAYNEHATFRQAIGSHYRTLKQLGGRPVAA